MEFVVRVHSAGRPASDVVIAVEPSHTVAELARALAAWFTGVPDGSHAAGAVPPTLTIARLGGVVDPDIAVTQSGIVSGDDLLLNPLSTLPRVEPIPLRAVTVDILAGPHAGVSMIVRQGRYRVGRDSAVDIVIDDPTMAAHQLDVVVGPDWSTTIHPLPGTPNPVTVNGQVVDGPAAITSDDVVGCGSTRLASRTFVRMPSERTDQLGQIEFQRTPYRPATVTTRTVPELGAAPRRSEPRRFQLFAVLAPLVAGIVMFAFSRQVQFLALTALSPLAMIGTWIEDRRSGRGADAIQRAAFQARLDERAVLLGNALDAERVERLRAHPDLAELGRRAELRTVELWERGRQAADFMSLRLGLGRLATAIEIPDEPIDDDALRRAVDALSATAAVIGNVPIAVAINTEGVVAIEGERTTVDDAVASLVLQAACLHSPEDLTIVAATPPESSVGRWAKWLPHTRSVASPLSGAHVVHDRPSTDELVERLLEVAEFRAAFPDRERPARSWPHVFVVIDADVEPDLVNISKLLDIGHSTGISVLWLARHEADVPRQARRVLRLTPRGTHTTGVLWSTDPGIATIDVDVETLRPDIADRTARALAPVRDASSGSATTSIPRIAPLLDVLGVGTPTPAWISEAWHYTSGRYALDAPIGLGADGPVIVDLVEDGPHTLIGGTSGSGKSELLQSIVAALAARHSPQRLNFLFVDYKGGASSTVFTDLPHTVGYVTNLSAELSRRALVSLRAELERRMRILEGRAKDIREMLDVSSEETPPSLIIVVDEFATLVKEVPDFVAGIVDVAQRGRSLGIHLILATQRPSGAVNENILANTNLRISLRMLDRSESVAVIGSPEAADLPVPLRGRGYVRRGPRSLVAVQSAYCSAPLLSSEASVPVLIGAFNDHHVALKSPRPDVAGNRTHLDAVLEAINEAAAQLRLPPPRRPWRDVLDEHISLDTVLADERAADAQRYPGRVVAVGMLDLPEQQDQRPLLVDLETGGGLVVFGSGGSGRTTVLRTVAASAARTDHGGQLAIVGFDFASRGLVPISELPQCVGVATGDDLEATTRYLAMLTAELHRRRALLAEARAEHLTAYNERNPPEPRILVLIDGYTAMSAAFAATGGNSMSVATPLDAWLDHAHQVIIDGRQVGIHTVITTDRRGSIPARLHAAIGDRLILRHADESAYTDHGIPAAVAANLSPSPGRGLWAAAHTAQIAIVGNDPSAAGQAEVLARLGRAATRLPLPPTLAVHVLPEHVSWRAVAQPTEPWTVTIGVADLGNEAAIVDLSRSHLAIVGPPGSGRSTALLTCLSSLTDPRRPDPHEVWVVGAPSSTLQPGARRAIGNTEQIAMLLDTLLEAASMGDERRRVLIVDDLDYLDEFRHNETWDRLARSPVRIIASLQSRSMTGYSQNSLLGEMRRSRKAALLQPNDASEVLGLFGVRAPFRPGLGFPPGRAVLIDGRSVRLIQIAS